MKNYPKLPCTVLRFATIYGLACRVRFDLLVHEFIRDAWTDKSVEIYGPDGWRPGGASFLRQKYTFQAEVNKVTWQLGRARAMLFIAEERQMHACLFAAMKIWINHHLKFAATAHCKLLQGMRLRGIQSEGLLLWERRVMESCWRRRVVCQARDNHRKRAIWRAFARWHEKLWVRLGHKSSGLVKIQRACLIEIRINTRYGFDRWYTTTLEGNIERRQKRQEQRTVIAAKLVATSNHRVYYCDWTFHFFKKWQLGVHKTKLIGTLLRRMVQKLTYWETRKLLYRWCGHLIALRAGKVAALKLEHHLSAVISMLHIGTWLLSRRRCQRALQGIRAKTDAQKRRLNKEEEKRRALEKKQQDLLFKLKKVLLGHLGQWILIERALAGVRFWAFKVFTEHTRHLRLTLDVATTENVTVRGEAFEAQMRFQHAVADSGAMLRQLAGTPASEPTFLTQAHMVNSARATENRHRDNLAQMQVIAADNAAHAAAAQQHAMAAYTPPPLVPAVPPPPPPQLPPQLPPREYRSWLKPKTTTSASGEESPSGERTPLGAMTSNNGGKSPAAPTPPTETTPSATPAYMAPSSTYRGWTGFSDAAVNPLIPHHQRTARPPPEMTVESQLLVDDLNELQKDLRAMLG